jgi:hypothetical protein
MSLAERDELLAAIKAVETRQAEQLRVQEPLDNHLNALLDAFWPAYTIWDRARAAEQARRLGG